MSGGLAPGARESRESPRARGGRARFAARVGLLAALAAAAGYDPIPNVELISIVLFLAGAHVGLGAGLVVALIGRGLHSLVNPWGPAPPIIVVGNVAGSMLFAAAGALLGPAIANRLSVAAGAVALAGVGAAVTLAYDVVTNLATVVTMGAQAEPLPVLLMGVPLAVVHIISNAIVFPVVGSPLLARVVRRDRDDPGSGTRP